jgi:hypothetical protein
MLASFAGRVARTMSALTTNAHDSRQDGRDAGH